MSISTAGSKGEIPLGYENAFRLLKAGGDESFIARGRVVFAGAVHGLLCFPEGSATLLGWTEC